MQRWKPGCGCYLEETVHPSGKKTLSRVLAKCSVHASVPDSELYAVLYTAPDSETNLRLNAMRTLLEDDALAETKVEDGQSARVFKPGVFIEHNWVGEGRGRVLRVRVHGAPAGFETRLRVVKPRTELID